jgi:phage-related protein
MRTFSYLNPDGATIEFSNYPYMITNLSGIDSPSLSIQEKFAPYQDGSTYIDGLYGARDITIEGAIASAPMDVVGMAAARRLIIKALNPKTGVGLLTFTGDSGTFEIPAIPVSSPVFAYRDSNEPYQRFQVAFHAPSPYWTDVSDTVLTLSYTGSYVTFPFAFAPGGSAFGSLGTINGQVINIDNTGDVATPLTMVFNGPSVNPKIQNNTTGEYIQLNKTLVAGECITVYTAFGRKTVTFTSGGTTISAMQYLDLLSTFFVLELGANQLQFIDDGTKIGASASVTYRKQFIGV